MGVTNLDFKGFEDALKRPGLVVLDFWASWCAPCRAFAPVFEAAAGKHPDALFAKVNTEEQQELAGALQIRSIPTLMVFRDGVLLYREAGALPQSALNSLLDQVAALDMTKVLADVKAQEATAAPQRA